MREYTGTLVRAVDSSVDVSALCSYAAQDQLAYPLLSGVDPYDDTIFNARQAAVLSMELASLAAEAPDESLRMAAVELLSLAALLEVQPGRPHHRRLLFIGD
ncbi:hypothetical protein [Kribbella sp. HUAS MG21]|uniref:Uncharacterized protein n=1 Tax=Kribbella sp. HUAS MG21 TaxID=3160966 RepID=A0AAU7TIF2_9ACTN